MNDKLNGKQDNLGFTPVTQGGKTKITLTWDRTTKITIGNSYHGVILMNWMIKRRRITKQFTIPDPGLAVYIDFTGMYSFLENEKTIGVAGFGAGYAWAFCTDVVAYNEKIGMNVCNIGSDRGRTLTGWIEFFTYAPYPE